MALVDEIERIVYSCPRGPARWRAQETAARVLTLLRRYGLLPRQEQAAPTAGILTIRDYARLPEEQRRPIAEHLLTNQIGPWMLAGIRLGPDRWEVALWKQAPEGGPLWGLVDGVPRPLSYRRSIPAPGRPG